MTTYGKFHGSGDIWLWDQRSHCEHVRVYYMRELARVLRQREERAFYNAMYKRV